MTPSEVVALVRQPSPWPFLALCHIEHRVTKRFIPFTTPTPEQRDWVNTLTAFPESICLKSRNVGLGVATQLVHFWRAWRRAWKGLGTNTLVVAHADDTAKQHLTRYFEFNARLPEEIRLEVATRNEADLKFIVPGTGTEDRPAEFVWFRAVTAAGKRGEGRGFTQHQLHITEFAFYENGARNFSTTTSAMHRLQPDDPDYENDPYHVVVETTPNGPGGFYPVLFAEHDGPGGTMAARFYPWFMNPTFRAPPPPDFEPTSEEMVLADMYRLDDAQLQWRRLKIKKTTVEDFQREFPATRDEAFARSGDSFFSPEYLAPRREEVQRRYIAAGKQKAPTGERVFAHPDSGRRYAVAVDIGAGVGEDYSVIQVVSSTMEQVYCYSDNETNALRIAEMARSVAIRYNHAILLVESNSLGMAAVFRLQELGYPLFMEKGKPFYVHGTATTGNKKDIFGWAKSQIDQGRVTVHDYWTLNELIGMGRSGQRRDRANGKRGHDDHATALVYALWAARRIPQQADQRVKAIMARRRRSVSNTMSMFGGAR